MRVVITGAGGRLGGHAVREMLGAGHHVLGVDQVLPARIESECRLIDIRDLGQVCGALRGCDGVLHLAAIASPLSDPAEIVFATNALGTFNILEAASLLGISRVVTASSVSALGVAYGTRPVPLRYVPIDEDHPLLPQDAYGLSKQVGEEICAAFHRRTGGDAVSLRFPTIWDSAVVPGLLDGLSGSEIEARKTLFSYVESRDAARALRLALETTGLGAQAFYVTAPETFMRVPSADLARRHFPGLLEVRGNETGRWSFHDCSRAQRAFGFKALHVAGQR